MYFLDNNIDDLTTTPDDLNDDYHFLDIHIDMAI